MRDIETGPRKSFLNRTGYLSAGVLFIIIVGLVVYFSVTPSVVTAP